MSSADEPLPRDLTDRAIRQSLRHPANLRALLNQVVPDLAAGFDCERARLLDREFVFEDWRRQEADLPFEIPYRTGTGEAFALVCVLIEHQSGTVTLMPLRMLNYTVGYWHRQWKEWSAGAPPRPPFRLRPVLPLVLYTGAVPWGSNRTLADLLGEPAAFHAFAPRWEPLFWNLADQSAQALLESGEGWLQMLSVLRVVGAPEDDFRSVFTDAMQRLRSLLGIEEVRWADLLNIVLSYAVSRRPAGERQALVEAARHVNPDRMGEVNTMSRTGAEAWIEEGRALERAEAELRINKDVVQRLLRNRFGPLPDAIAQRINDATDVEWLRSVFDQASRIHALDELNL